MRPTDLKLKPLELNKPYKKNLRRQWPENSKWLLRTQMKSKKRGRSDKKSCSVSGSENKTLQSKRKKDRWLLRKQESFGLRDFITLLSLKKKESPKWRSKEKLKRLESRLNKKLPQSMREKLKNNNSELLEPRLSPLPKLTLRKLKS